MIAVDRRHGTVERECAWCGRSTSTENQPTIDEARQDAQQEREQLLADAKQGADHDREQARRAVDKASQQRIKILEQLMGIYRDLEAVPAALESTYQERKNPPEASVMVPLRPENQHGVSRGEPRR